MMTTYFYHIEINGPNGFLESGVITLPVAGITSQEAYQLAVDKITDKYSILFKEIKNISMKNLSKVG